MNLQTLDIMFSALPPEIRSARPDYGLVLGSGWNRAVADLKEMCSVSFADIPGLGAAGVQGHSGRIVLAEHPMQAGRTLLVFCGRRHWYEGVGWEAIIYPIDVFRRLAIRTVLLTNASGGVSPDFAPGDIVAITDHLRMSSVCPLQGAHLPEFGARFPDQSCVYSDGLIRRLEDVAKPLGIALRRAVYAFTSGPVFETPAEIRAYAALGAGLVGMSTVPEAMVASACGMEVAAVSLVSNKAAGLGGATLTHAEVLEAAERATPKMAALILGFVSHE